MASPEEQAPGCAFSSFSVGLTTSTSDREISAFKRSVGREEELADWMARILESLQSIEANISSQNLAVQELLAGLSQWPPTPFATKGTRAPDSPMSKTPAEPTELPPALPNALGRVLEQSDESGDLLPSDGSFRKSNLSSRRRSLRSSGEGRASQAVEAFFAARDPQSNQYGMMHELEEHNAFRLIQRRRGRAHSRQKPEAARAGPMPASESVSPLASRAESQPSSPKRRAPTITSRVGGDDKETMLSRVRRVSLEDLRNNYDAVLVSKARLPGSTWETTTATALPAIARFLLCATGILQCKEGRAWRALAWLSFAMIPFSAACVLTYHSVKSGVDTSVIVTLCCFVAGVLTATLNLKRAGISVLLGPNGYTLDEYALEAGFLQDWWKVSRWRAGEVAIFAAGMVVAKALLNFFFTGTLYAAGTAVEQGAGYLYWLLASYYLVLCYVHLHICCGLELAVDSFGLRFFKDMDMDQAVEEWNQVQATLRQVSRKLSGSLLLLGSSCLACLAILAEKVIQQPDMLLDPAKALPYVGWFYPLISLYLYIMLRAAAVTEKAGRVAPLINAWTFQDQDEDGDQPVGWMDQERQYIVQYINQSEAGFYIRGTRLTAFNVQKMTYYFAAFSFALFSQLSAANN